ncbi:MAG: hypothetical protein KAW51_02730 [Candidatus Lokiarchaeota archaeon]|nr:hypothetical protein [Candidatus Lokiarchaeota archaeon]
MKVLQDIWIVEKSGIVIFHREFDKVVSPQLFGAMMSALNMFAEQLAEGGLSNFELQNSRFTIIKKGALIFVANSSKKYNQKKVNKELKKISDKFINLYSDKLKTFKGQIGVFSNFKKEIENALEEKPV